MLVDPAVAAEDLYFQRTGRQELDLPSLAGHGDTHHEGFGPGGRQLVVKRPLFEDSRKPSMLATVPSYRGTSIICRTACRVKV